MWSFDTRASARIYIWQVLDALAEIAMIYRFRAAHVAYVIMFI